MLKLDAEHVHNLSKRIRDLSGEDVTHCIQCGKCSGGCTVAPDMEEIPSRIMRFIQLNMKERALTSSMVWTCTSCLTCTARCPEGIDPSHRLSREEAQQCITIKPGLTEYPGIGHSYELMPAAFGEHLNWHIARLTDVARAKGL